MAIRIVLATLASLVLALPATAGSTQLAAQLRFPVPAYDIGDSQLGVDAGVSVTHMENPHFGVGLDVMYHHWPASSAYTAAFDRYLRTTRMEALVDPGWALSAFQFTGHVKVVAPPRGGCSPWLKLGAGAYRLDLNLDPRRPDGTYSWIEGPETGNVRLVAGGYGELGVDFLTSSAVVLGVDATFHYVWSGKRSTWGFGGLNDFQDFSALSVGGHMMFGRR
jgi:hypothetical protein